jgi:hypothetical protein
VAAALSVVLRDHGWAVSSNARRLRASLSDLLGAEADEHRAAVDAIVLAVEEGIVADLHVAGREGLEDALPALSSRLADWGLAAGPAAWAVRTWAQHLPVSTVQPPATRPGASEPTTLPPIETAPGAGATSAPPVASSPTMLPSAVATGPARQAGKPRRRPSARALAVAGAVVVLMAGGVAAAVALGGDDTEKSSEAETEASEPRSDDLAPAAAEPGVVLAAPDVRVPALTTRAAMAGRTGGVRIARLGEVDSIGTGEDERTAPEGGSLVAFRLGAWSCDSSSCRDWKSLGLKVDIDGTRRALPDTAAADTFVVAVPGGTRSVDLVMRGDGRTQTISLLDGKPGRHNIAVLARDRRVDRVGARFRMSERTSTPFNYDGVERYSVPRDVTVSRAELTWFADGAHPSSPDRAFLKVRTHYTVPLGSYVGSEFAFEPREMVFIAGDGTRFEARDLDDGDGVNAVFEVPASLKGGRLVLGGRSYPAVSGSTTFTRTLSRRSVPLRFE